MVLAVIAGMAVIAAGAQAADTAARQFDAREDVRQISLSPDGKRVAMLRSTKGAGTAVFVADLTTGAEPRAVLASTGRPDQLTGCHWSTERRLVCTMATLMMQNGTRLGFTRVLTLALQSAVLDPALFKAIVAIAPVTDLDMHRAESRYFTDHAIEDARIGHGPHVREGSPAQTVDRIAAPVLLVHGDLDQNVGVGESRLMAARLKGAGKRVDYIKYKGLTHQLDDADVRADMLDKSDAFLRKALTARG